MQRVIDQQIKQMEMSAEQMKKRLDDFRDSFIRIVKPFVITYYKQQAQSAVQNNPARVQQLGTEGLAPVKRKIEELVKQSDAAVEAIFARAGFWPHLAQPLPQPMELHYETKIDQIAALRKALWPVFPILGEVGLADKEFLRIGMSQQYYPFALPDFPQFDHTRKAYQETYEAYFQMLQQIQSLQKQKAEHEAKTIWDNA